MSYILALENKWRIHLLFLLHSKTKNKEPRCRQDMSQTSVQRWYHEEKAIFEMTIVLHEYINHEMRTLGSFGDGFSVSWFSSLSSSSLLCSTVTSTCCRIQLRLPDDDVCASFRSSTVSLTERVELVRIGGGTSKYIRSCWFTLYLSLKEASFISFSTVNFPILERSYHERHCFILLLHNTHFRFAFFSVSSSAVCY